jgi:hypothetical protein
MNMDEDIDIGYVEIPKKYWKLESGIKRLHCEKIMEAMLIELDLQLPPEISRIKVLDDILESSIQSNEKDENYEICEVFRDIRKILNEA